MIEANPIVASKIVNKANYGPMEDATTVGSVAGGEAEQICIPSATLDIWFNPDTFENEI